MNNKRIGVLDFYRFIAVTMVVLFHYYHKWADRAGLLPYGEKYSNAFMAHGNLGVDFFFIISGFVIYYTIVKCDNLSEFFKKRFIRLYPPLLLASVITFFMVILLDPPSQFPFLHSSYSAFIPSLSFIDPNDWVSFFHRPYYGYIDGAYWSLFIEAKFYLIAGILYFVFRKEHFVRNWAILIILLQIFDYMNQYGVLYYIMPAQNTAALVNKVNSLFIVQYYLLFTLGIFFYDYFNNRKLRWEYLVLPNLVRLYLYHQPGHLVQGLYLLFFILCFVLLLFDNPIVRLLDRLKLKYIGVISYTIYLLHQNIGLLLIHKICALLPYPSLYGFVPVLVYLLVILVAHLFYHYYELPSKRVLSNILIKRKKELPILQKAES